jgi:hypothetical protein
LKLASPFLTAPAAALISAAFAVASIAQAPSTQPPPAESGHHHEEPAPKNLKVLPKTMTGEQVHEVMHGWAGALGTECSHCHAEDPNRKMPNGRPALNFSDDSKPEKNTARLMYKMVKDINENYVSMVPASQEKPQPVTCGTCHRGHVKPPEFVPPKHEHDHDHPAPGGEAPPTTH